MNVEFVTFEPGEIIPVNDHLKNRKLAKYFNKETAAAIVCASKLLKNISIDPETPFYYSFGLTEYEDYGLNNLAVSSMDEHGKFSNRFFIEKGMAIVSPLTQFKVLYNMPLCFVSIEHGLKGDNAVLYSSASGLLTQAMYAPHDGQILLGAGKVYENGRIESGFAIVTKSDVKNCNFVTRSGYAIDIFRSWAGRT